MWTQGQTRSCCFGNCFLPSSSSGWLTPVDSERVAWHQLVASLKLFRGQVYATHKMRGLDLHSSCILWNRGVLVWCRTALTMKPKFKLTDQATCWPQIAFWTKNIAPIRNKHVQFRSPLTVSQLDKTLSKREFFALSEKKLWCAVWKLVVLEGVNRAQLCWQRSWYFLRLQREIWLCVLCLCAKNALPKISPITERSRSILPRVLWNDAQQKR